jgi:hypothetical protein
VHAFRELTTLVIFMRTSNPQAPLVTYFVVTLYAFYWVYVAKWHGHAKLRHTVLYGCDMTWRDVVRHAVSAHPIHAPKLFAATTWSKIAVHPRAILPVVVVQSLSTNTSKGPSVSC